MALEANIQAGILRKLKARDIWYTKIHQTGRGRNGIPDVLACYKGTFLAIEVKNERGVPSDHQVRELHAIRRSGGYAILARSWEDVQEALGLIDGGHQFPQPPLPPENSVTRVQL